MNKMVEMLDYYDLTTQRGKEIGKKKPVKNEEERNKQKIFELTEIDDSRNNNSKRLSNAEMKKTSSRSNQKIIRLWNNELQ